jgi:hypothetical protein
MRLAEYPCPIRLRGARYLYLNVAVEKRNISGVEGYKTTSGLRWIFYMHLEFSRPAMCNNAIMIISSQM